MNRNRYKVLSEDLYNYVFQMLDAEPEMDGETAGKVATEVQKVFLTQSEDDYEVVVGNIGTVYLGKNQDEADQAYNEYATQSATGYGRAGGEEVTLFKNGGVQANNKQFLG